MYLVEVNGTAVGYIVSEPLFAGTDYVYSIANVIPSTAPDTTDEDALTDVPCFAKGVMILTDTGQVPVEDLRVGDMIHTAQNGLQAIRWIGSTHVSSTALKNRPNLRPIHIRAGAFGPNQPCRDMHVSRQHRFVVASKIVQRMFDVDAVMVGAIKCTALPDIEIDETVQEVTYFHILLDRHEVIFAEGVPTESLYTGPQGLAALGAQARNEIARILPETNRSDYAPVSALPIPEGRRQKNLIARHCKHNKPLLQPDLAPKALFAIPDPDAGVQPIYGPVPKGQKRAI